jgi:tetratricopeptide (TPR) repeat protein
MFAELSLSVGSLAGIPPAMAGRTEALTASLRLSALAAVLFAASPARAVVRDGWDQRDVEAMRAKSPRSVELLEQGEAKATAGAFGEALDLFQRAEREFPTALVLRRECEALTALGRRNEAVETCSRVTAAAQTGTNLRAFVRAHVDGPARPTPSDLIQALTIMGVVRNRGRGAATAPAMACDIAATIGDGPMLQHCAAELERVAPNDPATKRANALLSARCPPMRFWAGWTAIAAAVVLTILHALRRAASRMRIGKAAVAVAITLFALAVPVQVRAADAPAASAQAPAVDAPKPVETPHGWLSKWKIDDNEPAKSIPSDENRDKDPLEFGYFLQDLILKGELASKRGDHIASARFYDALSQAVPDRAVSFSKACDEYEAAGDITKATNACGQAIAHDGTRVGDYVHFVHLVLAGNPGQLTVQELQATRTVIDHMKTDDAGRDAAYDLECEVGARAFNVEMLRECAGILNSRAPDDLKTIRYRWALAVLEGDYAEAHDLIDRASSMGAPVDMWKQQTMKSEKHHRLQVLLGLLAAALLIGAGLAAWPVLRKRNAAAAAAS